MAQKSDSLVATYDRIKLTNQEETPAQTAVIFDPESLILDPRDGIEYGLRKAMHDLGIKIPPGWFTGFWSPRMPFRDALTSLLRSEEPHWHSEAVERYFVHFNSEGRFLCSPHPGGVEMLNRLARNPQFELHYLTHLGAETAVRLLDLHGLRPLVESVVTTEAPSCPGARISLLKQFIERKKRPRQSWVLLSDHPWELLAAKQLELPCVALAYGRASVQNLCGLAPGAVAATVADVEPTLEAITGWREYHHARAVSLRFH